MAKQWSEIYANRIDDEANWCAISKANEELVRPNTVVHKVSFEAMDNMTIVLNNTEELPIASGKTAEVDNDDLHSILSWKIKEADKKYRFWFGYRTR